jgi:hypothetical protein
MATKVLTIQAGDTAIVKKGIKIKSIVKNGSINLSSDCFDLEQTEDYACYVFVIAAASHENSDTDPIERENTYAIGITVNGKYYPFPSNFVVDALPSIMAQIADIPELKGVFLEVCTSNSDYSGLHGYIVMKAIPSLMTNTYLVCTSTAGNAGSGTGFASVPIHYPIQTYDDAVAANNSNICACSTSSS